MIGLAPISRRSSAGGDDIAPVVAGGQRSDRQAQPAAGASGRSVAAGDRTAAEGGAAWAVESSDRAVEDMDFGGVCAVASAIMPVA